MMGSNSKYDVDAIKVIQQLKEKELLKLFNFYIERKDGIDNLKFEINAELDIIDA